MAQYRKKPVVIEAFQNEPGATLPPWMLAAVTEGTAYHFDTQIMIKTLEGEMRADVGDWVIKGVKGELYPCNPDIFAATYDPVEA